ncbi:MAG: glycosyltransferase [Clostridiales bacterium]|nr:glycosyltransferase [Clostridiales bacterium]
MSNKEKNFVSAIVYVHNAEARLPDFLGMIVRVFETNFEHSEIICVNDGSTDGSISVIRKISEGTTTTCISVVNMSNFHGLELAMDAGMDIAIGDFVFEFDNTYADFDESMIMKIYEHSLTGYDIVSASPNRKEKFTSRLFYHVFDRFSDVSYKLTTESFRILSRRVINRINSMNKTIPYRKAAYVGSGLKTDNLKYDVKPVTKLRVDKKERGFRAGLAIDSLILFTEVGFRFSLVMTTLMIILSLFMVIYTMVVFFVGNPIEGWTTTLLFLSVAFLGLFGILTIIVKYLQIIVDMVFKRKHYNVESIEKYSK